MRTVTVLTVTALAALVAIGPSWTTLAQPAPPAAAAAETDSRGPGMHRPRMGGPMEGHMDGPMGHHAGEHHGMHMHERAIDPSMFGLIYRPDDRKLTAPDVQKVAESLLLWFGNRTWKVVEVAPAANGTIAFAYATAEGSVIARFTMDSRTGRVVRTG